MKHTHSRSARTRHSPLTKLTLRQSRRRCRLFVPFFAFTIGAFATLCAAQEHRYTQEHRRTTVGQTMPESLSAAFASERFDADARTPQRSERARMGRAVEEQPVQAVPLYIPSADEPSVAPSTPPPRSTLQPYIEKGRQLWQQFTARVAKNTVVLLRNLCTYRQVQISGNYHVRKTELLQTARLDESVTFWELPPALIRQRIEQLAWIEAASLSYRMFPLRLELTVREAEPWLVAEYDGMSWLVSRSGELLQTLGSITDPDLIVQVAELPRLDGLEPQSGVESYLASANARFAYAAKLIRLLELAGEVPFEFDRIMLLRTGGLRISPIDRSRYPEVLLTAGNPAEARQALSRLNSVLGDLDRRNERARQIDLRFANQAIVR